MTPNLMLALLAMDAYNRGSNPALDEVQGYGTSVGDANILNISDAPLIGFSATAYQWNGKKIISFRGTDSPVDILTGWTIGAGLTSYGNTAGPAQLEAAKTFYQLVTNQGVFDGVDSNVILTGHSMGGALAGYIAALTGDQATVFDSEPFFGAALISALGEDVRNYGNYGDTALNYPITVTLHLIIRLRGGFTNEVQHVGYLNFTVAMPALPAAYCFMIGAAVKGDPQERGAIAHP